LQIREFPVERSRKWGKSTSETRKMPLYKRLKVRKRPH
jgi:hypothetical protein